MTRPACFADLDFEAALARAKTEGKLLLVAARSGSQLSQVMDRMTWSDAAVQARLAKDTIAIQFDVAEKPELAKELRIEYPPEVVVFKDGARFDRVANVQRPPELLEWLDGLARGETNLDRARAKMKENPHDFVSRMHLAGRLHGAGLFDEETRECEHLWRHMVEEGGPEAVFMKHRTFPLHLTQLFAQHAPARDVFARIRDEAAPKTEGRLDVDSLNDWLTLNSLLGDGAKTLAWWDAAKGKLERGPELDEVLETAVLPLLVAAERWADAGALYRDPRAKLKWEAEMFANIRTVHTVEGGVALISGAKGPELDKHLSPSRIQQKKLRDTAAQLVRALRAANRTEEADAVKADALGYDDSPEMREAVA